MRLFLLRLLLLTVCFHAVVGMPAHESGHMRQAASRMAQAAVLAELGEEAAHADPQEGAHGTCAWCLVYAQHAHALASQPPALPAVAVAGTQRVLQEARGHRPGPGRWPFASRDPPTTM